MSRTIPIFSAERGNEVIRRIYLKSSTTRSRSNSAYHVIRVGVQRGSAVDWLGQWSQAQTELTAGTKFALSGEPELNYPLEAEDEIVAYVSTVGSPASLDGMSVEVKGGRVGEVGETTHDRADGDYPGAAQVVSQLFTVSGSIQDPATRDSIEALISALNDSGITDWSHNQALTDTVTTSTVTQTTPAVYQDEHDGGVTISGTSYADGNVSITVTVPSDADSVFVQVIGKATGEGSSAQNIFMELTDGTTAFDEAESNSSGTNDTNTLVCIHAEEITSDTTYKLRFKRATANGTVTYQRITALAVAA